jgi:hypothetical protein
MRRWGISGMVGIQKSATAAWRYVFEIGTPQVVLLLLLLLLRGIPFGYLTEYI